MKKRLAAFKARLTSVSKEEPLNKLSLAAIIILDIIILNLLFVGLNDHTQQLTTLSEYMPSAAKSALIDQNWTSARRKILPLLWSRPIERMRRLPSTNPDRRIVLHPLRIGSWLVILIDRFEIVANRERKKKPQQQAIKY